MGRCRTLKSKILKQTSLILNKILTLNEIFFKLAIKKNKNPGLRITAGVGTLPSV